jgi:hypothetical protein
MDSINFDSIASLNCSLKETADEDEKILLYSDDNEKAALKLPPKIQFNDVFKTMVKSLNILSLNVPNILKEKKFSCKNLFHNFKSIKANKIDENIKKLKFVSIKDKSHLNKNPETNNNNLLNLNKGNSHSMSNIFSYSDISSMNSLNYSKGSNNSENIRNLTEHKRKRQNSHNDVKEDSKEVLNDILNICKSISSIQNNLIEIKGRQNQLLNDNNNKEITIVCKEKEIASISFNDNVVQKIHIIKDNKFFTEENDISNKLKNLRKYFNRILNKLKKSK